MKPPRKQGMTSAEYWAWRAEAEMDELQRQADRRLITIGNAMREAQRHLDEEAQKVFTTYRNRFGLSKEEALAYLGQPVTGAQYDALLRRISAMPLGDARNRLLQARLNSAAYAHRISRLEALRDNIAIELSRVGKVIEDETTGQLRFTAAEAYNQHMFAIQQQIGRAFAVPDIDGVRVSLSMPWLGYSYSERIWGNVNDLATKLEQKILEGFTGAKSWAKTSRELVDAFGVSYRRAETLVRTETSNLANQRNLQAYKDAKVDWYRYVAALDSRTCDKCGPLDRRVFPVAKAAVGVNFPTIHPNCRCITVGVLDKDAPLTGMRHARDADRKSIKVPNDMSYEEWKRWQETGAPGDIQGWRAGQNGPLQEQPTSAILRTEGVVGALINNGESDIIVDAEKSRRGNPQRVRYPVTQQQIDDILDNELSDYQFPVHPVYNPRIQVNGKTIAELNPWGGIKRIKSIQIGKQDSPAKKFLIDTLLHEYLEAEIMLMQKVDALHKKLNNATDPERHRWIYARIAEFFKKMEGS